MITHYTREVSCPQCGGPLDAASQVIGMATPTPGDLTLCWHCGTFLIFDEPPVVHAMTDAELAGLDDHEYEALRLVKHQWEAFKADDHGQP